MANTRTRKPRGSPPAPTQAGRRIVVRRTAQVTLAGTQPPPYFSTPAAPLSDPRTDALRRLELQIEQNRRDDRRVAERNQNVTRIDDPAGKVTQPELVAQFDNTQAAMLNTLSRLFVEQAGGLSSVQAVQAVIANVIGESVDLDLNRTNKLLTMLSEAKFLQTMAERLDLEPSVRSHLLTRYIDREWGPTPPPPVIVRTETNSTPATPKRRGPVAAERPSGGEDRPKTAARGNVSVGPFGALPNSGRK